MLDRFQIARDIGFEGVEILRPYNHDASELRDAAKAADCPVHLINAPFGPEWGNGANPAAQEIFHTEIEHAVSYAKILNARHIHILSGVQGNLETLRTNLKWASTKYPDQSFLIEPINTLDIPNYKLNSFDDAIKILRGINAPNLGLQFDTYHASRMQELSAACHTNVIQMSQACLPWIKHIQVSGNPNRTEPDQGRINHADFFSKIDAAGYDGLIGAEYTPASGSFDWLAKAR